MSILQIIHQIRDTLKRRLPVILAISLLAAIVTAIYIAQKPVEYVSHATIFPLSANSASSSSSPIFQLQQQFGLQGENDNEIYDIEQLIKSKRLAFAVVNKIPSNKKYKRLYEWLVADYNSEVRWPNKEMELPNTDKDSLSRLIIGRDLFLSAVSVVKEENGYNTIDVKAYNKELTKEIGENILEVLSEFYLQFTTEKPRKDIERIQAMRDSLSLALSDVERAIAGVQDQTAYATKAYVGLPQIKLKRKESEILAIYSTTVSALQNAKFKLFSESPIFQVLDYPGEPYDTVKQSWKPVAIVSFVLVFILLSLWFTRRIFINLIIEELKKA